ncbi:MAG: potassium channel family protein [Oscillospiraceae bacterium]
MKSVLIIGMGRFGRHLAAKMQEMGNQVMVIDKDSDIIETLSNRYTDCAIGDCTKEPVIESLGVENFDICFVTIGEDFQASLVITALLKRFGARIVVSKTKQDIQADLLRQIGASEIIYPDREIAEKIAVRYNSDNVFDFIPLTSEYAIYEIPVLASWVGSTIQGINVRNKYNINIVAIKRGTTLNPLPGAGYTFKEGDHIIVMGKSGDVFKLASRA